MAGILLLFSNTMSSSQRVMQYSCTVVYVAVVYSTISRFSYRKFNFEYLPPDRTNITCSRFLSFFLKYITDVAAHARCTLVGFYQKNVPNDHRVCGGDAGRSLLKFNASCRSIDRICSDTFRLT